MTENASPDKMDSAAPDARAPGRLLPRLEPKSHYETQGEKRFNFIAYNLIGYIANALMSVAAVYWVERTHSGRTWMDKYGDRISGQLGLNAEKAKFLARKSFFLSGGFAVLLPIKWMENVKVKLVEHWNRQIYGDRVDTDPVLRQSQQELEAEPKQSWLSIMASRALALVPFYITVGLLWDRTSPLSRLTNPALRGKSKTEVAAMEKSLGEVAFNQTASKGIYFDRPIAWASRKIGKAISWIAGNKPAMEEITAMEKQYPGMIKQSYTGTQDSNRSVVPYYFISEAITSGMVAWGVFALTRVLGPLFGKRQDVPPPMTMAEKMGLGAMEPKPVAAPVADAKREANAPGTKVSDAAHDSSKAHEKSAASIMTIA